MTTTERVGAYLRVRNALPAPQERAALRKAAGLTQRELAKLLDVSQAAVALWETGAREPAGTNRVKYVEALGVLREAS
jgi:DNA-binding transcriptional regulator YiaG